MRITCNQEAFLVGEPCSVEFILTLDKILHPGDCIQFQFPNSWSVVSGPSHTRELQYSDPDGEHFISVSTDKSAPAKFALSIRKRHLTFPTGSAVRHGREIRAELIEGSVPANTNIYIRYQNTFAPYIAETETLWLRVNDEAPDQAPVLTVRPGSCETFRVIAPSSAKPGDVFDVLLVSLDRFDNASCTFFEGEHLYLSDGATIAENLRFTGTLRAPVSLDTPGVYRFRYRDHLSNAVKVSPAARGPYWGDIHIHTKLSHDGQGTDPYTYARQVSGLDFAGVADHWESLGPQGYQLLRQWTEEANVPGVFATLPGDERNPVELTGHHNVYFSDIHAMDTCREMDEKNPPVSRYGFTSLAKSDPANVMLIPHHTGICFGDLSETDNEAVHWDACNDRELRPVLEIYSHHGQSESYAPRHLLAYEWNRLRNPERRANTSVPGPFYAQDYWIAGKRPGVIGSSDEHSGRGGLRHGGITAVFMDSLHRKNLFDAIRQRHCYATTGERILLEFSVDDIEMGQADRRDAGQTVRIQLKVWGTDTLLRVEVLRFRFGLDHTFVPIVSGFPKPETTDTDVSFEDTITTSCMYYARVTQEPLSWPGMAWTSPIWIDVKTPRNDSPRAV